jgi:hypothetical protein
VERVVLDALNIAASPPDTGAFGDSSPIALRTSRSTFAAPRMAHLVRMPDKCVKFVASFADSVFHHPHETFFDPTGFRRVTRYDGAGRDEF